MSIEAEIKNLLETCSGEEALYIQVQISPTDPNYATVGIRPLRQIDHLAVAENCMTLLREKGFQIVKSPYRESPLKTAFMVCKVA